MKTLKTTLNYQPFHLNDTRKVWRTVAIKRGMSKRVAAAMINRYAARLEAAWREPWITRTVDMTGDDWRNVILCLTTAIRSGWLINTSDNNQWTLTKAPKWIPHALSEPPFMRSNG